MLRSDIREFSDETDDILRTVQAMVVDVVEALSDQFLDKITV
jgi:hypothetical protein